MKIQKNLCSPLLGLLIPLSLLAACSTPSHSTSSAGATTTTPSSATTVAASPKAAPSSAIPAKREFPLSPTEKPCDDFHKYVCSEVESSFRLREDRRSHTFSFSDSHERLLDAKKKFMEELPTMKNLDARTAQVRDTYLACMDEKSSAASERQEVARVMDIMKTLKTSEEVLKFSHKTMGTELDSLIGYGGSANVDDSNKMDIWVGGSLMHLPDHSYYENKALMKDYQTLLTHFYETVYGKSLSAKDAAKKAKAIIAFQLDFIKVYPVTAVRRQRTSERRTMTQAEFIKAYPNIFPELFLAEAPKNDLVRLVVPETMEFINTHLKTYPASVWKDFYLLSVLEPVLDDAYPQFYQENFNLRKKYYGGPNTRPVRQERCTTFASGQFNMELDNALIDKVFPAFPEEQMQLIGKKIRESLLEGLRANTWLSTSARAGAIQKIEKIRLQMVRPHTDREWNFTPLRTYSAKDRIANAHLFHGASWEKNLKELGEPNNRDAWGMGPLTVNAYYSPSENKFVVPIGILQYPFFSKDNALIENIAAIGSVMGHEIGHSIDDNGANYDADGNIKPWMSAEDLAEFKKRSKGLVELFNSVGHNGTLTLGENVGDLVGLTSSYRAAFPKGKGSVADKQKFFVAYARSWCSVIRPGFDQFLLKTDPHALGWARINQQVKLQDGFHEAFNCKPGDKMFLPENERTKIW
jgi:putative endopeptidase